MIASLTGIINVSKPVSVVQIIDHDTAVIDGVSQSAQIQAELQIRHFYGSKGRGRYDIQRVFHTVTAVCPDIPGAGGRKCDLKHTGFIRIDSALRVSISPAIVDLVADLRIKGRLSAVVPIGEAAYKTQLQGCAGWDGVGVLQITFGICKVVEAGSAVSPESPACIVGNIDKITVGQYDLICGQTPTVNGRICTVQVIPEVFIRETKQAAGKINTAGTAGDINGRPI